MPVAVELSKPYVRVAASKEDNVAAVKWLQMFLGELCVCVCAEGGSWRQSIKSHAVGFELVKLWQHFCEHKFFVLQSGVATLSYRADVSISFSNLYFWF